MLTVCPLIDGAYPITSKEDAAATNPSVVVEDLRAGSTLATLTVAGGAVTSSGNFWICDLNHATASAVQTHLQRTRNSHVRLTWGMAAAGGGADQTEDIVSNTAEHDAILYPEGFIFADSVSGTAISSFAYGNGSKYEPVASLENAATVSVARGTPKRFNINGTFNGPSGVNGTLLGTEFVGAVVTAASATTITPASGTTLDVSYAVFDGNIRFHSWRGNATLSSNGAEFRGCRFTSSSGYGWFMGGGTFRNCTIENVAFRTAATMWNFALIGCTFGNSCNLDISVYGSSSPVPLTACTGDVTITMGTTETIEVIGHLAGVITTSGTQPTSISLSGTYQLNNAAGWTIASSVPAAVRPDLSANIVNLAAGSITATEAPNLDAAVSTRATLSSYQIDEHITTCPVINQAAGIEPYPQPSVVFPSAVTGTVQVRIYDVGANPMVELTTSALSGAELTSPSLTGLSNNYVLDMGHANVTAIVDSLTQENFEALVMFEDNGGSGQQRFVRVSCNTNDHIEQLYPEGAIYCEKGSGNTGTAFPNGSIFRKVDDIGDASHLIVNRGSTILDLGGSSYNQPGEITAAKIGTRLRGITIRSSQGIEFRIHNELIDLHGTTLEGSEGIGFGVRFFGTGRFTGQVTMKRCSIRHVYCENGGGGTTTQFSLLRFVECNINSGTNSTHVGRYGSANLYAVILTDCTFFSNPVVDGAGGAGIEITRPAGDFQLTGSIAKTISIAQCIGSLDVSLNAGMVNNTINISGVYNSITDNGSGNTINEKKLAATSDLTSNIVNLAAGAITPTEAPNLDVAVSSVSGGGGGASSIQIDSHIRACPLLNQATGLEPYPQPLVSFSAAPTGTVRARIYDTSVQPVVELTSTALSGAELTLSTAAGLSHTYVLDMGHANVTSVVDCMTREGLEALVMIEDGGGTQGQKFVKLTCNDPEHVEKLYPEGAIYADKGSGNTGIGFPNGSIFQKCSDLGDASQLIISRGSKLLDIAGSFANAGDITTAKVGTRLTGITIRHRGGGDFRIVYPEQVDFNGTTFLGNASRGFGIRCEELTVNGPYANFLGQVTFENCSIRNVWGQNGGGHTYAVMRFNNCIIRSGGLGTAQGGQLYAIEMTDCDFDPGSGTCRIDAKNPMADLSIRSPSGDFEISEINAKTINLTSCRGSGDITLRSSATTNPHGITFGAVTNCTVNVSGVYNSVSGGGSGNTINEKQLAHTSGLTGNIVNLAAGSITPTEAPNLDVAVSSVSGGGGGGTDWTTTEKNQIRHRLSLDGTHAVPTSTHGDIYDLTTRLTASRATNLDNLDAAVTSRSAFNAASDTVTVGTNNDKTGYAMAGTLQSLDALDAAQDTQHAQTQSDLATVDSLIDTLVARLTAARAGNLDNLDAASSTLATSTALTTVDTNVDTLIARLTAARATNLDNLDATVSSRATQSQILSDATPFPGANIDAAISSVGGGGGGTDWTTAEKNQIRYRLSLDGTQADPTTSSGDIETLLSTTNNTASDITTLLARIGTDDIALLKGMLLGNYVLDGGAGTADISYDGNGHAATMRIRVFDSASNTTAATFGASVAETGLLGTITVSSTATSGKSYPKNVKGTLT